MEINKLVDLNGLRTAPLLSNIQLKKLLGELETNIYNADWITIGIMAPSDTKAIEALKSISNKYSSIKFGNFTCLPRDVVKKLVYEKSTWNSFSGSLKKIENNLLPIPSIRGSRYFGPSKMSFLNLIKHSLSIMSVFRKTFLIRSGLFIILYILFIKSNASVVTALPLVFLLIAVYSISNLALRENMAEFEKALSNINDIENIK